MRRPFPSGRANKHIETDAQLAEALNGHPPITSHQEDRALYYAALEARDEKQEFLPMETFLREQAEKTWEKQLLRSERKEAKESVLGQLQRLKEGIPADKDPCETKKHVFER